MSKTDMPKPVEPSKDDCCNSGCTPCIFDIYEKQLQTYKKHLQGGDYLEYKENGISDIKYTEFVVFKNLQLCSAHNLILFKSQSPNNQQVWWKPGDHFLYKYISNDLICTRAYTPIHFSLNQNVTKESYDFAIIVKEYDRGIVSSHLCNLLEGSLTLWRGPYGHYTIEPNKYQRIIMIAQGTGIAPFITIINNILDNDDDMTKITLLYCCKSLCNILFRDELYAYKSYWNFTYKIYLSECSINGIKYQEPVLSNKLKLEDLTYLKPFSVNDQFLICGSQEFNKEYDIYLRENVLAAENILLF